MKQINLDNDILDTKNPYKERHFSYRNIIKRIIWLIIYYSLFRYSPVFLFGWRNTVLRTAGASVGKNSKIYPSTFIWAPWNLKMGRSSCLGPKVNCYNIDKLVIEDFCIISQGAFLCTGSHDYNSHNFKLISMPITISSYVWIGAESFIGPNVFIGEGAVVGARSVCFKTLKSWGVYAGNPIKYIKERTREIISIEK